MTFRWIKSHGTSKVKSNKFEAVSFDRRKFGIAFEVTKVKVGECRVRRIHRKAATKQDRCVRGRRTALQKEDKSNPSVGKAHRVPPGFSAVIYAR